MSKVLTTLLCTTTSKQVGSCLANANSKIFFACRSKERPSARLTSLKAQSRAKLGRSEFVAKWRCAFREQTDSRPSKKTKKTKDAKKKRYGVHYLSL